nr:PREDICTED: phosphorylated adapter RNA export protein [Bemisia tabaci]
MNCGKSELEALSTCPEYTPLPRPSHDVGSISSAPRELSDGEIEDDDDDDDKINLMRKSSDDSDCDLPLKRPRPAPQPRRMDAQNGHAASSRPRKKYDIWSTSLQEQAVLEEFNKCDVQNVDRSRAVESYFVSSEAQSTEDFPNEESDIEKTEENLRIIASELLETVPNNERKRKAIKRKKDLSRRGNYYEDEDLNIVPRYLPDLAKTANDSEEDLAQDLANKLFETKDELVRKVVNVIGKERAIKFFHETQNIEEEGGMQIKNQTRRRTPGGVYFFLVKLSCSPEENKILFSDDRCHQSRKRKKLKVQNRKAVDKKCEDQAKIDQQKLNDNLHKELPNLLKADLSLKHLSHEERDVPSPPPSPVMESLNPPPSPANDETPPLTSALSRSSPVQYDDLLTVQADEMELA